MIFLGGTTPLDWGVLSPPGFTPMVVHVYPHLARRQPWPNG